MDSHRYYYVTSLLHYVQDAFVVAAFVAAEHALAVPRDVLPVVECLHFRLLLHRLLVANPRVYLC